MHSKLYFGQLAVVHGKCLSAISIYIKVFKVRSLINPPRLYSQISYAVYPVISTSFMIIVITYDIIILAAIYERKRIHYISLSVFPIFALRFIGQITVTKRDFIPLFYCSLDFVYVIKNILAVFLDRIVTDKILF